MIIDQKLLLVCSKFLTKLPYLFHTTIILYTLYAKIILVIKTQQLILNSKNLKSILT